MDRRLRLLRPTLLVASLLQAAGCVVSPIPQPPNAGPELDLSAVAGGVCMGCDVDGQVIEGAPGALSVDGGVEGLSLWVVNLDRGDPPSLEPAEPDGSFWVVVPGAPGDQVRLQARAGELRGAPVDAILTSEQEPLSPVAHPLAECLAVALELDFGEAEAGQERSLELQNRCDEPLTLVGAALRAPSESFDVGAPPPSIPPGSSVSISVEYTGETAGLQEELLLIEARSEEMTDRRAVTLIATGR